MASQSGDLASLTVLLTKEPALVACRGKVSKLRRLDTYSGALRYTQLAAMWPAPVDRGRRPERVTCA